MIAGALAGGAAAAWLVVAVAARRRVSTVRRRLSATLPGDVVVGRPPASVSATRARLGSEARAVADDGGAALPDACDAIARSLRSGRSLAAAITDAAERHPHPALTEIARAVTLGEQLPRAVDRISTGDLDPDTVLVVQVLAVAAEHGGSQAEAIDRAAATLRERAALRAERHAQAASARISTRVMTILPFAFTGFVATTDPEVRDVLLRTPIGWVCLAVGVGLNLVGRTWARRAVAA